MKKAILVSFVVICCLSAGAFSVFAYKSNQTSLLDSNVEALADMEWMGGGIGTCYHDYQFMENIMFLKCGVCLYFYGVPTNTYYTGICK